MSTADPTRHLRKPVPQVVFNQKTLITRTVAAAKWINLRWRQYATNDDLFFASVSARLTPARGKIKCIYLSPTERTAFRELYGDKIHLSREAGLLPIIEANDFSERVFIDVELPELTLVDITTGVGIESIDLDLGTLYAPNPAFPREFAQAIVDHPAKVAGILYESRHTKEHCAVVWNAHHPALLAVPWGGSRTLGSLVNKMEGDIATVFDSKIQIAS